MEIDGNRLLLGIVAILILIGAGVAGFLLSRQDTVPATAARSADQREGQAQPTSQAANPAPAALQQAQDTAQSTAARRTTTNGFPLYAPAEVNALRTQPDVLVIDVRGDLVWASEHVPGAISFPEDQAEQRYDELPRDKLIIAY